MGKAYLILEDGHVFEGEHFGAVGNSLGELVFTTGMAGYIETLTDPSYYGQIVMQTFPLIGNYGIIPEDFESPGSKVSGYVVREWCDFPSNFRSEYDLNEFLIKNNIVGICGVDTRQITRLIRDNGVMNARIVTDKTAAGLDELKAYKIVNALEAVSTAETFSSAPEGEIKHRVVLYDYGEKRNIVRELVKRGCEVSSVPYDTTADEVLALKPDGVMLSNGPGDPKDNPVCIAELAKLIGKIPMFGICLGHQLLALACGGDTYKLKYGHRGANQPVKYLNNSGRVYITSQNHGYAVNAESLAGKAVQSFENANDGSCEGLDYVDMQAFSVQFHPEACAGPLDTTFLFDRFISMMDESKVK